MNIAVIPARGGSKRIPRKNIRPFAGKPMLAWAVDTAIRSSLFAHVIVSTDDEEIASLARAHGAETPFVRPANLADDHTPTVPVIAHAVDFCRRAGWDVEYACCIYPATPLLKATDLLAAYELLRERQADFVYPVTEYPHPIQRAMRRTDTGQMQFIDPGAELTRTQDLEKSYHDCGQFYWGRASAWLEGKRMHTAGIGMPIPHWRVVDIDSEDDWHRAELMFRALATA
ncbi:pseudaminic acid cytidylyltransferase [Ramlibacter sp.]|uniref:pseudaminic acid cytidylyltransferase n=1 Tax=Ramlibacter sp. TaxID=1917967 RepID=UPI003D0979B5